MLDSTHCISYDEKTQVETHLEVLYRKFAILAKVFVMHFLSQTNATSDSGEEEKEQLTLDRNIAMLV